MKICLTCHARHSDPGWHCPQCGSEPPDHAGIPQLGRATNPEGHEGFDDSHFAILAALEADHFWFTSRNDLILWAVRRYFPACRNLLEIGCGTGFVLQALRATLPAITVSGSERSLEGLRFASQRVPGAQLMQMDARHIPFESEFDVIGLFDVLEHIEEDGAVLRELHKALTPGGGVVITVPQHRFLWSDFDSESRHQRRYSRRDLLTKLAAAGFTVLRATSFNALLLPALMLRRRASSPRQARQEPLAELRGIPPAINSFCRGINRLEGMFIQAGVSFPAGGSLLVVART